MERRNIGTVNQRNISGVRRFAEASGPPLFFVLATAAVVMFLAVFVFEQSVEWRYREELRHHVEALAGQIRLLIVDPHQEVAYQSEKANDSKSSRDLKSSPDPMVFQDLNDPKLHNVLNDKNLSSSEPERSIQKLVEIARWDCSDAEGCGYFFVYQEFKCIANGGFPEMKNKDFKNGGLEEDEYQYLRALRDASDVSDDPQPQRAFLPHFGPDLEILENSCTLPPSRTGKYVSYCWRKPLPPQSQPIPTVLQGKPPQTNPVTTGDKRKRFPKLGFCVKIFDQNLLKENLRKKLLGEKLNDKQLDEQVENQLKPYKPYVDWWVGAGVYTDDTIVAWRRAALWSLLGIVIICLAGFQLSQHLRSFVLNMVPEAILITNKKNRLKFANDKAVRLFGYDSMREMLQLRTLMDLVPEPRRADFEADMLEVDKGNTVQKYHAARLRKDGTLLWVHSRIEPFRPGKKRIHAIYDLTKQHEFDVETAERETNRVQAGDHQTLLIVQINLQELIENRDAEPATKIYQDFLDKLDDEVKKLLGERVELWPPPPGNPAKTAVRFTAVGDHDSRALEAALALLTVFFKWKNSHEVDTLSKLHAEIYLCRCFVKIVDEKARLPRIASGGEVGRALPLLDEVCSPNLVTISDQLYKKLLAQGVLRPLRSGQLQFRGDGVTQLLEVLEMRDPRGRVFKSVSLQDKSRPRCFISYSSKDHEFADRLYSDLRKNAVDCWFAPHKMPPGQYISDEIQKEIRRADWVLVILSSDSIRSEWVKFEIGLAFELQAERSGEVLLPIRLVGFDELQIWQCLNSSRTIDLAAELRKMYISDFTTWNDPDSSSYEREFKQLLGKLKSESAEGHTA